MGRLSNKSTELSWLCHLHIFAVRQRKREPPLQELLASIGWKLEEVEAVATAGSLGQRRQRRQRRESYQVLAVGRMDRTQGSNIGTWEIVKAQPWSPCCCRPLAASLV